MQKFVELQRRRGNPTNKANRWLSTCIALGIPYITVTTRTVFADVELGRMACASDVRLRRDGMDLDLQEAAIEIFTKHAAGSTRADCIAGDLLIQYKNLDIARARQAAIDLFDLVVNHRTSRARRTTER